MTASKQVLTLFYFREHLFKLFHDSSLLYYINYNNNKKSFILNLIFIYWKNKIQYIIIAFTFNKYPKLLKILLNVSKVFLNNDYVNLWQILKNLLLNYYLNRIEYLFDFNDELKFLLKKKMVFLLLNLFIYKFEG